MIIINGQEPISKYNKFSMTEEVNGAFEVSFTSFNLNNLGHELIEEEALISVVGYDFKIKQMKEIMNRKEVTAISTFYDLVGHRQENIFGGTRTLDEFLSFTFNGTGWTFTSDVTGARLIANFGTDNVIKLVQSLCQAFECEFKIMPNNHMHFSKQIGSDNDAQYRYGHNVKALSKAVDTTNLRTKIKGYGADNLVVTYVSPNAEIFGVIEADPVHDDRFTIGENLVEYIKKGLIDYPEVSLELDTIELTNKELGERVWLIYEPLNIEFQTRILAKKSVMRNGKLVTASVVLGNAMPKTLGDILASQKVEIDENKKQVQSRFEQVNDRITLEVEEVGESIAGLEIRVGEAELYVEKLEESVAKINVKAENIQLSVTDLSGRMGNAESQINIQAGEISQKVSQTDYNGETLVSMINQTPSHVKIQAKNITLQGAVTVLSELSNDLGTITAGQLNAVNINTENDISVGSNLSLGTTYTNSYSIRFGGKLGASAITYSGDTLTLGAINGVSIPDALRMGYNSRVDFTGATTILGIPKSDTYGLGFGYSAASNRLYVRINGSDMGYIQLS